MHRFLTIDQDMHGLSNFVVAEEILVTWPEFLSVHPCLCLPFCMVRLPSSAPPTAYRGPVCCMRLCVRTRMLAPAGGGGGGTCGRQ